jgi:hypothetical protein
MAEPGHDPRRGALRRFEERPLPRPTLEPTFFSRYECKYVVDPLILDPLRAYLRAFVVPDRFAAGRPGYRYPVCSLYLDSEDLRLYRQTADGERQRFKLRVRTYSDDPATKAYIEVKKKDSAIVQKRRAGVERAQVRALLERRDSSWFDGLDAGRRADAEEFVHHMNVVSARPLLRVRYQREAYQATGGEPARITIDSELTYALGLGSELGHADGRFFPVPLGGVILEIKFTDRFPWWVQDLVREFGLNQRAVPKYLLCVERMLREHRGGVVSFGAQILAPREM